MSESKIIEQHTYRGELKERIEQYARKVIKSIPSNSGIKKAIIKGQIRVNGKTVRTAHRMRDGERLELYKAAGSHPEFELNIQVCFEDEEMAVVNKPAGLPTHSHGLKNLINCLTYNLQESKQEDALERPLPVHRLDQQTSGLVLIAKTKKAQLTLDEGLRESKIQKTYLALVHGTIDQEGTIDSPIDGKDSKSSFKRLDTFKRGGRDYSLIEASPITGRTHQLRIHFSLNDHPIVGDRKYGLDEREIKGRGLMLFAQKLVFNHPTTGEMTVIEAETPKKFMKMMP